MANQILLWITLVLTLTTSEVYTFRCDRRPYGTTMQASPSDGRFKLIIDGADDAYIPEQLYTVRLTETDGESRFTSFMISAEGDMKPDPRNPRRMVSLSPGELRPQDSFSTKFSDRCLYSVEQAISSLKSSVEVYWQAPASGNGCVLMRAMLAENEDLWFEDGSPLSQKLCEDMRQPDDVTPQLNYNCQICDEAKYELSFTGIWSRNTHPRNYPENDWIPRYSDLVGASHTADLIIWAPGTLVSDGFRDLAEHANSSKLEAEMMGKVGNGVRTIIKGKGHGYKKMNNPIYSFFRADKENHLFTASIAIYPSPDWFLGVTRFELCQEDNTWLPERELNLYPWDAGTDSGVSYESPNIETFPQDAVSRVQMSSYDKNSPFYETDILDLHPFGRLHIKLVRTYHRECVVEETEPEETASTTTENVEETDEETNGEPESPSSEEPIVTDPESPVDCPMSKWQAWSPCEGICEGGKLRGYRWRERYHLVDGIPVEKYDPDSRYPKKEVPFYCKQHKHDFEREECEVDCAEDNNEVTVERRVMAPVGPGKSWNAKKRHLLRL